MTAIFTSPGKLGDMLLQWPVAYQYAKTTGEKIEFWMDRVTCKPAQRLLEAQPCVASVRLVGGIRNWNCGGQPWDLGYAGSSWQGRPIYHLGLREHPIRPITIASAQHSPIPTSPEQLAEPSLFVATVAKENRLLIHGRAKDHCGNRTVVWTWLENIADWIDKAFDVVEFIGGPADRELGVGKFGARGWGEFDDGHDFLTLSERMAASRLVIGSGSNGVALAGALGVPSVRVHDPINSFPQEIWGNIGANQLNATIFELRRGWDEWKERWVECM